MVSRATAVDYGQNEMKPLFTLSKSSLNERERKRLRTERCTGSVDEWVPERGCSLIIPDVSLPGNNEQVFAYLLHVRKPKTKFENKDNKTTETNKHILFALLTQTNNNKHYK